MQINIADIIKAETKKLNVLFQKAAYNSKKELALFTDEDYTYVKDAQSYFGTFNVPYFLTFAVLKDVEYRIKSPYPGTIWYWKKDIDNQKSTDFLPIQSKLMYDTLNSYMMLLKSNNHLHALILFRSYIEYSSQFYASLLDYDFFQKYTSVENLEEQFKQNWFKNLKPSKVLNRIKSMHAEIDQLLIEQKISYAGNAVYRRNFKPFDSSLRGFLYESLSGLAHGSYSELIKNDEAKLQALVWICSTYLVESQAVIDEITSVYFAYTPEELFTKWITIEIYLKSREAEVILFLPEFKT